MKFAPELQRRRQLAQDRRQLIQREGENYAMATGEYRQELYLDDAPDYRPRSVEQLRGVEKDLYSLLVQYPGVLAEREIKRPAILLDFGGMIGLSMVRIAAHPNIAKRIAKGEIAVVVTNLGFDMQAEFTKRPSERLSPLSTDEALFVATFRHLIHYIQGDAATVLRSQIKLPTHEEVPLKGNVDLLHERLALAHGFKNDLDIPRLGKLISPVGQLWLGTKPDQVMQALNPQHNQGRDVLDARSQAYQAGVENLTDLGLAPIQTNRPMSYTIFKHQSQQLV